MFLSSKKMFKETIKDMSGITNSHLNKKGSCKLLISHQNNYNPIIARYGKYLPNYYNPQNQQKLKEQFDFSLLNKLSTLSSNGKLKSLSKPIVNSNKSKKNNSSLLSNITTTSNTTTLSSISSFASSSNNSSVIKAICGSLVGLNNLGNICYMSAALQILIHCPPFITELKNCHPTNKISKTFLTMCYEMAKNIKSFSPIEMKKVFEENHHDYVGYKQHDSMEYFRLLLDDISKENNIVNEEEIKKVKYEELSTKNKSKYEINRDYDLLYRKRENSFVINLFYPQLINTFQCKCGYISYSFEKIIDIPLLLINEKNLSLEKLLDHYFSEENFKWESNCENCKKKEYHTKNTKFISLPKILSFSFQRINERLHTKNDIPISFSTQININKYCDEIKNYDECNYSLFGINNHCGSIDFGHYYAKCKINDQWYEFNDSNVSIDKSISTNLSSVYCLFYINNNQ